MRLPEQIRGAFPVRPYDLNKYSAGTVAIVGGSCRFPHAPVLAGLGARAGGAGLVHLVVPEASRAAAGCLTPEATLLGLTAACVPPKADVVAVGMGLGVSAASTQLVSRLVRGFEGRLVLDADALNILAKRPAGRAARSALPADHVRILTPHAGEAARLLSTTSEAVLADRVAAVRELARRYRAITVLKGPNTLVAAPDDDGLFICRAGNPFMAQGGMGDLLSGVIAARWANLAQRLPEDVPPAKLALLAAASAVWLHATASDDLVYSAEPVDPSLVNTAHRMAALRVKLERGKHGRS